MSEDIKINISEGNKRILTNTLFMYSRMLVLMVVSLYTTRVVFNALGVESYGIYGVVGGVIAFFSFINQGLVGASQRYITAEMAEGTLESQQSIFKQSFVSHLIIIGVIFLLAETIGLWLVNNVLNIPDGRMVAANVVFQASIFVTLLGVLQSPYMAAIIASEKMSIYAYLSVFDAILKLAVAFIIIKAPGDKLISYAILIFLISVVDFLIYYIYCKRKINFCRLSSPIDRVRIKSLFGYMGWSLFGQATNIAANQGVTMLVNVFCGVIVNAAIGVSNQVIGTVNSFVGNFQVAFRPQLTKFYVSKDYASLCKLTTRSSRLSAVLLLVFFVPICFALDDFLTLWLGDYPQYTVEFCLLTLICLYVEGIGFPLIVILTSSEDIKKYQIIVSVLYSTNVILSWFFLSLGFVPYIVIIVRLAVGVVILISRIVLVVKQGVSYNWREWTMACVIKPIVAVVLSIGVLLLFRNVTIQNILPRLLFHAGMAFVIISLFLYFLVIERSEKLLVKNWIIKHFFQR